MSIAKIFLENSKSDVLKEPVLFLKIQDTFFKRFFGLMFKPKLSQKEGVIFINNNTNIIDSTIHMFFMNFDIAVFWLDPEFQIVDKTLARKWHPIYAPKKPAKMIIETHYNNFENFDIGDRFRIEFA